MVPRNLLRYVAETLQNPALIIASLRMYERRPTLYEHQQRDRDHLGLKDGPCRRGRPGGHAGVHAQEAAHADNLVTSAEAQG